MAKSKQEAIEGELVETQWNIKRIIIGAVIVVALLILASYILFPSGVKDDQNKEALGITSGNADGREVQSLPSKEDIETIIQSAQETLSAITSDNLTSSQAAIQRLIADFQKLQKDKGPAGILCDLVCKEK